MILDDGRQARCDAMRWTVLRLDGPDRRSFGQHLWPGETWEQVDIATSGPSGAHGLFLLLHRLVKDAA